MADRVGFEPTRPFSPPHFKCGAISLSATFPIFSQYVNELAIKNPNLFRIRILKIFFEKFTYLSDPFECHVLDSV